jgi:hypothetical protein
MNLEVSHDRTTDVAYVDACPKPASHVRIDVVDVTKQLGLKTQVLARVTEDGEVLGLVIQDYGKFKRELRVKYLSLAVERLLELLLSKVRLFAHCEHDHQIPAEAMHA